MASPQKPPRGRTMMGRNTSENRELSPNGPFGFVDVVDSVCTVDNQCPHYRHYATTLEEDVASRSIHILIASFRDRFCARTIHNAFSAAKNPNRIFLRIIDQTQSNSDLKDDQGCWHGYCQDYNARCKELRNQVRIIPFDAALSKGPTWARSKLSAMMRWDYIHQNSSQLLDFVPVHPDDFCLEIDSHMAFSDSYDERLVAMLHRTMNDYSILTTYPPQLKHNNHNDTNVPNLCMVTFDEISGTMKNWAIKVCQDLQKPKLTNAMWGAGFSFMRCHAELKVPVDPYLDYVFDGEEIGRAMRFFTHGYDMYTPDQVLVTHDYDGHQANTVIDSWRRNKVRPSSGDGETNMTQFNLDYNWMEDIESERSMWRVFGTQRVNMLLGIGPYFSNPLAMSEEDCKEVREIRQSRYGLGSIRSLEQAAKFAGIDFATKRMTSNKCGNLLWVPYTEEQPPSSITFSNSERGQWWSQRSHNVKKYSTNFVEPSLLLQRQMKGHSGVWMIICQPETQALLWWLLVTLFVLVGFSISCLQRVLPRHCWPWNTMTFFGFATFSLVLLNLQQIGCISKL